MKQVVAAFDFDGTLTYCDSLVFFLVDAFGLFRTCQGLFLEIPAMLAYLLSLKSRQEMKERLLCRFLKGLSMKNLNEYGQQFAEKSLARILRPSAIDKLRWHQNQGHRCVLVSASIEIYLKPWAESMKITDLLASRLAFDAKERATGYLEGLNCWGPEKVRRLLELLGPKEEYILYAYGDSQGDLDMLALADYPHRI